MAARSGDGSEKISDPTRYDKRSKIDKSEVGDWETTGGLESKPGGAPTTTAAF